ncbi:MAG: hypothetical protein HKO63_00210 [Acidimicrobiia bacterium]|nr:hypothetical protein [Acidimicrobiia bacterium]
MKRFIPMGCALALALSLAACAGSRDEITQEFLPDTGPTTTSVSTTVTTSSTSITTPVDPIAEIGELASRVAEIRQLPLDVPPIETRSAQEVLDGYQAVTGLSLTGDDRFDAEFLQMVGVLEDDGAVADLLSVCSIPGYYDPAMGTLVLREGLSELTPLGQKNLFEELTTAATDTAHDWWGTMQSLSASGDADAAAALFGLVRGDAVFHASQYVESQLTPTDRFAITLEQISCDQQRSIPPGYVAELEAFGPEVGRAFVEDLISTGGVSAVDAAYRTPPQSSEQIYHPARYPADRPVAIDPPQLAVSGFTEVDAGVFGELQLRALLSDGILSSQALQAATGWGGDSYRLLWDGTDLVLVLLYEGDEARDARELAETLGGWASASMSVGSGRPDNTGLAFEGQEYAFVAHNEAAMLLVLSSDARAGRDIRDEFWPDW